MGKWNEIDMAERFNIIDSEIQKDVAMLEQKVADFPVKYEITGAWIRPFFLDTPRKDDRPYSYINIATHSSTVNPDIFKIIKDSGFEIYSVWYNNTHKIVIGIYREIDIEAVENYERNKMEIIAVCGSVKFKDEMLEYRDEQMKNGKWVLLPENMDVDIQKIDDQVKKEMDKLHLRKIDCADKVLIWNRGGYVGESTRKEREYAKAHNKDIEFIEYTNEMK